MAGFWRLNYEGGSIENYGMAVSFVEGWYLSPVSLLSHGFMYGTGDVWFNTDAETIQQVEWEPCACSPECD